MFISAYGSKSVDTSVDMNVDMSVGSCNYSGIDNQYSTLSSLPCLASASSLKWASWTGWASYFYIDLSSFIFHIRFLFFSICSRDPWVHDVWIGTRYLFVPVFLSTPSFPYQEIRLISRGARTTSSRFGSWDGRACSKDCESGWGHCIDFQEEWGRVHGDW